MSLKAKTVNAGKWQLANVALFSIMNVVFLMIMARLVDKSYHGTFAIMQVLVIILSMLSRGGLYNALVRREQNTASQISFTFWGSLLLGVIFTAVIYFLAEPIVLFYGNVFPVGVVRLISLYFVFVAIGLVPLGLMVREMDFKSIFIAQCGSYLLGGVVVGVTMALAGKQLWALVYSFLGFTLLNSVMNYIRHPHSLRWCFTGADFHEVKHFGLGVTLTEFMNSLAVFVDKLIVGKFVSLTALAIFEKGQQTTRLPVKIFGNAFDVIIYSVFSKLQNNASARVAAFRRLSSILWMIVIVLSIFMSFYARHIVMIILGISWVSAIPILQVFAIAMPSLMIVKICDSLFRSADKNYVSSRLKLIYVASIVVSSLLASTYSIMLVSYAIAGSYLLHACLYARSACSLLRVPFAEYLRDILPAVYLGIASILLQFGLRSLLSDDVGRLVMMIIAGISQMGFIVLAMIYLPWLLGRDNVIFFATMIGESKLMARMPYAIQQRVRAMQLL